MNFRPLLLCLSTWILGLGAAHAASVSWTNEYEIRTYESGAFDILYRGQVYDLTVAPYSTLDHHIWYFADNPSGGQGVNKIDTLIEQQFGIPQGTLNLVSHCDSTTSGCTGATATAGVSSTGKAINTFTSSNPFEYLAVHFGQGELLFAWADPGVRSVTITGIPNSSLSNYRAYVDPAVIATPLPAAGLLFAGALAVGGVLRRGTRQRKAA